MAQAGIHGLVGMAVKKYFPSQTWLAMGIVVGNMFPDADALAVAVATLAGLPSERLHRTFTHSILAILVLVVGGYLVTWRTRQPRWKNLGIGLGIGTLMHIMVDLVVWFRGVEVFWPLSMEFNFWQSVTPPAWWYDKLELPLEFLLMALFFLYLGKVAREQGVDGDYLPRLRRWTIIMVVLFAVFTPLVYIMETGFIIVFGVFYLIMLWLGIRIPVRMKASVDGAVSGGD